MPTIDEMHTELLRAHAEGEDTMEVLMGFYADPIDVAHVPALPSDRVMRKEEILLGTRMQMVGYRSFMADYRKDSTFTIDGDTLVVTAPVRGTLADGTAVDEDVTVTYWVKDGEIVRFAAAVDPESVARLGRVLAEGGVLDRKSVV